MSLYRGYQYGYAAVSYTHLDVYKRQAEGYIRQAGDSGDYLICSAVTAYGNQRGILVFPADGIGKRSSMPPVLCEKDLVLDRFSVKLGFYKLPSADTSVGAGFGIDDKIVHSGSPEIGFIVM